LRAGTHRKKRISSIKRKGDGQADNVGEQRLQSTLRLSETDYRVTAGECYRVSISCKPMTQLMRDGVTPERRNDKALQR